MMDELDRIKGFRAAEAGPTQTAQQHARSILVRAIAGESRRPPERPRWRRWRLPAARASPLRGRDRRGSSRHPPPRSEQFIHRPDLGGRSCTGTTCPSRRDAVVYPAPRAVPLRGAGSTNSSSKEAAKSCALIIGRSGLAPTDPGCCENASARAASPPRRIEPGAPGCPARRPAGSRSRAAPAPCGSPPTVSPWGRQPIGAGFPAPHILLRQMRRLDGGPQTRAEDFVHVGDFLRETDAPARIRAALYRAAALIPGVQLLGWVHDHYGRRGLGISYSAKGSTSELIFNSKTGELLGEQSTGQIKDWSVYLHDRVVNHLPSRAPAPLKPPCIRTEGTIKHTAHGDVMVGNGHGPNSQPNPALLPMSVLQRGALGPALGRRFARELSTRHMSVHQLDGVPHVLVFWASKCSPCRQDARLIERAWRTNGRAKGILFVGIDTADTEAHALGFIHRSGLTTCSSTCPSAPSPPRRSSSMPPER